MDGRDYWDAIEDLAQRAAWDEIDELASTVASAKTRSALVRDAAQVSTTEYESALDRMLEEGIGKLRSEVKALYWEFDLDNGWSSALFLTHSYAMLDDSWISSEDVTDGPSFQPFADLYRRRSRLSRAGADAVEDLLAGRTIAAFGRAHQRTGPTDRPVVAAFHDSGLQIHMPRPGIDLRKERTRAERTQRRLSPGKWHWLQGHTETRSPTRLGVARLTSSKTAVFDDVTKMFRIDVHPVTLWEVPELQLDAGDFADVQPTIGFFPLVSDRLKRILETHSTSHDPLQWLPVVVGEPTGEESRRYWIPHPTRVPDVVDLDRCGYHEKGWQIHTVVFEETKLERMGIVPSLMGLRIDGRIRSRSSLDLAGVATDMSLQRHALLVSADAANAVVQARCTGVEWATVRTEVPKLPPHLRESYGPPPELRGAT